MEVTEPNLKPKSVPQPRKNLNIHIYLDPAIIAIFLCVCYSRVPIEESDAILAYSWITFQIFAGVTLTLGELFLAPRTYHLIITFLMCEIPNCIAFLLLKNLLTSNGFVMEIQQTVCIFAGVFYVATVILIHLLCVYHSVFASEAKQNQQIAILRTTFGIIYTIFLGGYAYLFSAFDIYEIKFIGSLFLPVLVTSLGEIQWENPLNSMESRQLSSVRRFFVKFLLSAMICLIFAICIYPFGVVPDEDVIYRGHPNKPVQRVSMFLIWMYTFGFAMVRDMSLAHPIKFSARECECQRKLEKTNAMLRHI